MLMISRFPLILLLPLLIFTNCIKKKSELAWKTSLYNIGTQSSPRTADLNGDGVLDIVIGAAEGEYKPTDQGILAIDGATGIVLWKQEATDQVFGSATFYDVTKDGIVDVFIGGRSHNFKALNGANGQVLWDYKFAFEDDSILKYARYNFYSSVLIPDQNENSYPELLVMNGGNAKALPNTTENRVPGVLMVLDSKSGHILAADTMPDGKESYMSPICFSQPNSEEIQIVFGTGGETISGSLYLAALSDLMVGNLKAAEVIATEINHGFISPPVVVDISQDYHYDIIAISHGSTIFAINGKNKQQLWKTKIENTESSSSLAVGYFNEDNVPDLFAFLSKGVWPNSTKGVQVMLDGKDGRISYQDSLGCVGFWSPVAYDLNNDGIDEAVISYSDFNCYRDSSDMSPLNVENKLVAIDFNKHSVLTIDSNKEFKNISSTPWIGDLDSDGYLDIVYSQCYSPNNNLLSFLGMSMKRISTNVRIKQDPLWGGYMGSDGNGIFPLKQ